MAKTTGKITVVFPDHHVKLADGLWNLFRRHQGVDFDLRWADRSIRAHRLILDVFFSPDKLARCGQQMNQDDRRPDPPTVEAGLEEYLPSTNYLDSLLEFLYRGQVTVGEDTLERLLELAGELDLRVLVDAIEAARNGTSDSVQKTPKRRQRKGIPVKLANKNGDDLDQSSEDSDDPPYVANPRPVAKVAIGAKRGRGRPRGSCKAAGDKRTAPVKRRKKRETSDSEEGESGSGESGEEKEKAVPIKKKRKAVKEAKVEGGPSRKHLWLKRQPVLSCLHCPYKTHCKRSYVIHEARHDKTMQIFRCDMCSVAFLTEETLERHKSSQHPTAPIALSCQLCDYSTTKKSNLTSHVASVHRLNAKGEPITKTYNCSLCKYTSVFASHLANHEMTHKTDKPFQCDKCTYACVRKYDLDKHYKIVHLNLRLFLCVECGHQSPSQVALTIHMRSHTFEKPFSCLECGKAYASKTKLKLHTTRHHSNDMSLTCNICGFLAYRRDCLQIHMKRIHQTTLTK